ncbi:uncharacterized protein PHALS_01549 [Plasmopara halstedii]|uniref:Uncharacterized protein n=1 Tax=Plasmopara halstedii TaxID=4781 RepID=A0A0P1AUW3_PLAHL|nr:uncharacterized protein PHALS_01549 [Plasmopara halstedii]CEG45239.1 hypothetical protein PHALS_01549 [Plasmopara halstedii]|eukprot:XP_024581608.1 hypothetical protein PHALS_01549 [Plasmopara halstedii]
MRGIQKAKHATAVYEKLKALNRQFVESYTTQGVIHNKWVSTTKIDIDEKLKHTVLLRLHQE